MMKFGLLTAGLSALSRLAQAADRDPQDFGEMFRCAKILAEAFPDVL